MGQNFFNLRFSSIANALHSRCTSLLNFALKLLFFSPLYWTENVWSDTSCLFRGTKAVLRPRNSRAGKKHFRILLLPSAGVIQLLP